MNYYNENDPHAVRWIKSLIAAKLVPDGMVDERSITEVKASDLTGFTQCHFFAGICGWSEALRLAGWPADRPVWTASCPCQPFSNSGNKKGTDDHRDLWPIFFRIARDAKPDAIFGEQVNAAIRWGWIDRLCDDMEEEGYAIGTVVLPACAVRAPHIRERIYWVADFECKRQPKSWQHWENSSDNTTTEFREADWLVDAVRRKALPFLCSSHDGVPSRLGEIAIKGFGNAIVPQIAAEFIAAYMELEHAIP